MDTIELDIVYQTYPVPGLKNYLVIEAETGDVVDSVDMCTLSFLHGSATSEPLEWTAIEDSPKFLTKVGGTRKK
jgi:hypothetical protein